MLTALLLCALSFGVFGPALAQQAGKETKPEAAATPKGDQDEFAELVDKLNQDIKRKKDEINDLRDQMKAYQRRIEEKRQETASVQGQLSILENKIAKTELDIRANELEIEATTLEIGELQSQIQEKTLKMIKQRAMIAELLRAIDKTDHRTAIDLFLTEQTLSDFFNDVKYLQDSQRELKGALDTVKKLKQDLEKRESEQLAKKAHLEDLAEKLENAKSELSEEKSAKLTLAEQLRVAEVKFRYELAQLQKEEAAINADIAATERRLRKTLDEERLRRLSGGTTGWAWPVDPSRGITTYFHDPEYPFRYVYEHPGLDIRAYQGTAVRATKGGYVGRAKDAGMGYSYVMLIHDNDMSSVYGHLSRIAVKEDTYVEKGEIIGYSGGQPGTPGAGNLTTGPHLHFEIRSSGIPVNPLNFLSL